MPCPLLGRKKLIVLAKSAGIEDIEFAFREKRPDYPVYFMPRSLVKISCHYFLQNRVTDNEYFFDDKEIEAGKNAYRDYLKQVLHAFDRWFGLGAVLQFNIVYYAERELAAACTESGIPFVTLYKENLRSQATWHESTQIFQNVVRKYDGFKIAVYSEAAKASLVESKVVQPWQIEAVGCARMDYAHALRVKLNQPHDPPHVLYYLISPHAGLGFLMKKGGRFHDESRSGQKQVFWGALIEKVNAAFLNAARALPEISFIAKGKTGVSLAQTQALGADVSGNVRIIRDGVGHKLLENACVVIGFNSTAVLEAVAAGVPTIVPHVFTEQEDPLIPYVLEVCEAVHCPRSMEELEALIIELAQTDHRSKGLTTGQEKTLDRLLGNPDGQAGARLRNFIDETIKIDRIEVLKMKQDF